MKIHAFMFANRRTMFIIIFASLTKRATADILYILSKIRS